MFNCYILKISEMLNSLKKTNFNHNSLQHYSNSSVKNINHFYTCVYFSWFPNYIYLYFNIHLKKNDTFFSIFHTSLVK